MTLDISEEQRAAKLAALMNIEGFASSEDLMIHYAAEAVCPAICINPECDYVENMEPDQEEGHCPECDANTLVSAMVLAGVI